MTTRDLALLLIAAGCTAAVLHRAGVFAWLRSLAVRLGSVRPPSWLEKQWANVVLVGIALFCVVSVVGVPSVPAIQWPKIEWPTIAAPAKATAAVYTFEKGATGVPSPVAAAIDKLNRQGILATRDEVDTTDGDGQVPDQYKISRPAAAAAGLPALVVMGGEKVVRVVKAPTTEAEVLEAVK